MASAEGVRVDVLVDVAGGAGAQRGDHGALLGEAGDDQHPGRVGQLAQSAQRLDAVHAGHLDVHQDDVGPQFLGAGDSLGAVGRLADDLDVVLDLQEGAQAPADHLVVVDRSSTRRSRWPQPPGTSISIVVPSPGADRTVSLPPTPLAAVPHGDQAEVAARPADRAGVRSPCRRR